MARLTYGRTDGRTDPLIEIPVASKNVFLHTHTFQFHSLSYRFPILMQSRQHARCILHHRHSRGHPMSRSLQQKIGVELERVGKGDLDGGGNRFRVTFASSFFVVDANHIFPGTSPKNGQIPANSVFDRGHQVGRLYVGQFRGCASPKARSRMRRSAGGTGRGGNLCGCGRRFRLPFRIGKRREIVEILRSRRRASIADGRFVDDDDAAVVDGQFRIFELLFRRF